MSFSPVGRIVSPFNGKFGVPRQSGLVPSAVGLIRFFPPWNQAEAFRGLEGFSHVWILFLADQIPEDKEPSLTVRPPRLGGNTRLGVFATRSLFRPNPIGLSLVELRKILVDDGGVTLEVAGLDLVDGTPVLDVKPYLPYVEAQPDAQGGFATEAPPMLPVVLSPEAEIRLTSIETRQPGFRTLLLETMAFDPRPAYLEEVANREFAFELQGIGVRFTWTPDEGLLILDLTENS